MVMKRRNVETQLLSSLLGGEKRYTDLIKTTGRPDRTVHKNLEKLQERGLVEKRGYGKYGLTEQGFELAEEKLNREERSNLSRNPNWHEKGDLTEKIRKKLHLHGAALDLQRDISAKEIIATGGLMAIKNLIEGYAKLGTLENHYLDLLSQLYVRSPRSFLGKTPPELELSDIKAAWRNVPPHARNEKIEREGLVFDFPNAWNHTEKSKELKEKLKERKIDKKYIFRRLRAFSFPVRERISLAKENKL